MKKKIISMLLAVITIFSLFTTMSYASSTPSSWAQSEVTLAIENELVTQSVMNDYQANITREQFCEMVVRAYEKISRNDASTGNVTFADTSNAEICKAANLGIVNGYGNGVFAPNDLITREQICAMLVRMIDKAAIYANINVYNDNYFNDKISISDWALSSVNFAYDKGIMQGVGNNCIAPQANTTCEQAILLVYRTVNKYDIGEAYYCESDEENIVIDEDTKTCFVNNELILHMETDTPKDIVEKLTRKYSAIIVGEISIIDTYQIKLEKICSYSELTELISDLESEQYVSWVSLNMAFEDGADYFPLSDTKWSDEWNNEIVGGINWGVEAINAPKAWDYHDIMKYTNVGVYDCCFYDHKDLIYNETYYNHTNECSEGSHGTHVSGTIAAGFDNQLGISGVAPKVNLYGFSYNNSLVSKYNTTMKHELAFIDLIVFSGCKVLNFSNNTGKLNAAIASSGDFEYINYIYSLAAEEGKFLKCLIEKGYDFTLCVAAGNGNATTYYKYQSIKMPLEIHYTEKKPNNWSSMPGLYKETELNGNYLAFYNNYLNAIIDTAVKDRIIVVGSCKLNSDGSYSYSDFSGIGDRVDVMAPGEKIYSTIEDNGYDSWDGTSMATPHVSGVAAMLYSLVPTLRGDKVKQIIVDTAMNTPKCDYKLLNAEKAVEELLKTKKVAITVGDKDTNGRISDATVSYGSNLIETTDVIGNCDIYLVDDNHKITISKEGYKTVTATVEDKYIGQNNEWAEVKNIYLEKENPSITNDEFIVKAYIEILKHYEQEKEWVYNSYFYPQYYVYDIDKDEIPELIIDENKNEAEKKIHIFTYDSSSNTAKYMDNHSSGHSAICSVPEENGLMLLSRQMGYEYAFIINKNFENIISNKVIDGKDCNNMNDYSVEYDEPNNIVNGSDYLEHMDVNNYELLYNYFDFYKDILNGDFSRVAGKYTYPSGIQWTLLSDGLSEDDYSQSELWGTTYRVENITKKVDGSYSWDISIYDNDEYMDGVTCILWPKGVDAIAYDGSVLKTDTSKIRMWIGNAEVSDSEYICQK